MGRMKTLMVTVEGGGNVPPMMKLGTQLRGTGHDVTVLTEPCMKDTVENQGHAFIPFREYFTREDRKEDLFRDWNASSTKSPVLELVTFGPARPVVEQVIELIQSRKIDLLVVDFLLLPSLIAAEYCGIPSVAVVHMPEFLPGPNRPPGNLGIRPGNGLIFRLRDRVLGRLMHSTFNKFKPELNSLLNAYSLKPLENTLDLFDRADLKLVQTLKSFDIPVEPAPANVRYTGPVLDDPDWAAGEGWEDPWNGRFTGPLVVVSFSSTFQNQAGTIQHCIDALAGTGFRGCVTLGPAMNGAEFPVPENVVVRQSVSHSRLFPHADLVITHGGHGTIMRALSHGLPVVCMPMGRDQADNGIKVERSGCGIMVSAKSSPERIRKAVMQLVSDGTCKRNAQRMKEQIHSGQNLGEVLEEIEALLPQEA